MNGKLIFRAGIQAGKEFPLADEDITIGRVLENNIVLDDVQISRNHMKIFQKDGDLFIEDMKSTNGTILNGKVLKKAQKLKNGDMVTLGENNIFEVQLGSAEDAAEVKKAEPAKRKFMKFGKSDKRPKEVEELLENAQEKPKAPSVEEMEAEPAEKPTKEPAKKLSITEKYPTWVIILFIAICFIIVFCIIPWVVIEVADLWCTLFSGLFNSISPGVCP